MCGTQWAPLLRTYEGLRIQNGDISTDYRVIRRYTYMALCLQNPSLHPTHQWEGCRGVRKTRVNKREMICIWFPKWPILVRPRDPGGSRSWAPRLLQVGIELLHTRQERQGLLLPGHQTRVRGCLPGIPEAIILQAPSISPSAYSQIYAWCFLRGLPFLGCWVGMACRSQAFWNLLPLLPPSTPVLGPALLQSQLSSSSIYFQVPRLSEGWRSFGWVPTDLKAQSLLTGFRPGRPLGREEHLKFIPVREKNKHKLVSPSISLPQMFTLHSSITSTQNISD